MSTQVQYRRGSNVQVAAFTGALGELVIDTTNKVVVVNDGATVGGFPQVGLTASQTITNKVYQGSTVSVTGTVTAASTVGGVITGSSASLSGNVSGGNLNVTGNIVDTGALGVVTGSNGNITLDPNGTGVIVVTKDIRNGQANAVGNIGSSTGYFNTVFAKATSAQYADLAEMYLSDEEYAPGTVVEFGGSAEITQTTVSHSAKVAGIISTNPSYLMNATMEGTPALPVALVGRVPCRVVGTIVKGDRLAASDVPGAATALDDQQYRPACIIGKALEDYDSSDIGTIEVAVGRT